MKYSKTIFQAILIFILSALLSVSTGTGSPRKEPDKPVKIGLLIPDNKYVAARQGAELAVRLANEKGGLNGVPLQLVVRSMEGPWGTGSKQAVDLIFNEKVWALLGSHDGRNAHLVEQAATKSIVPFVSAWAGDPTLSQAFVPWFFNCVPNDFQQAETLYEEIYLQRKLNRIVTLSDKDYDSKMALSNFLKKIRLSQKPDPLQFIYEDSDKPDDLIDKILAPAAECIVLFCTPSASLEIYNRIRERNLNCTVFSSHYILNENLLTEKELQSYDNTLLIATGKWSYRKYTAFSQDYEKTYGKPPGIAASCAFDGMNVLIEAIRNAGTREREMIQKSLEKINHEGVTGSVSFDNMGNRKGPYVITAVKNGVPVMEE